MKVPGTDHPITVTANPHRIRVRIGDRQIADTTAALTLQESTYPAVQYVPLADVDPASLRPSDTSTHCPYKGDASYYDLVNGDTTVADAVWSYREPYPAVAPIADHVAFYPQHVAMEIDPA